MVDGQPDSDDGLNRVPPGEAPEPPPMREVDAYAVISYLLSGVILYGGIGWFSRVAIKLAPQKMFKDVGSQWGYAGFRDAHHPETWNPRMTLVEEASLAHAPEVDLFPGWIRIPTKLMGRSKTGARKARILRYKF